MRPQHHHAHLGLTADERTLLGACIVPQHCQKDAILFHLHICLPGYRQSFASPCSPTGNLIEPAPVQTRSGHRHVTQIGTECDEYR